MAPLHIVYGSSPTDKETSLNTMDICNIVFLKTNRTKTPCANLRGGTRTGLSSGRATWNLTTLPLRRSWDIVPADYEDGSMDAVAGAYNAGLALSFDGLFSGEERRRIELPGYPFQRERYWIDPPRREEPPRLPRVPRVPPLLPS